MSFRLVPLTEESLRTVVREQGPDLPTLGTLETHRQMSGEDTVVHRIAAVTPEGRMVGYGMAVTGTWDPMPSPGHFEIRVRVESERRGCGVGDAILRDLERFAREHGARVLEGCVSDSAPVDLSWAERRGFSTVQHVFGSELDLETFDPAPFAGVIERAESRGIRFASLAECAQGESGVEQLIDFYWELTGDIPGMGDRTREQVRQSVTSGPRWAPEAVILALSGQEWAAMAFLAEGRQGALYHAMTGVRRSYRGSGLGLAVKLKAIAFAREQGVRFMSTYNDSTNQPMLAVNRKLGFQPTGGIFWLRKTL